MDTMRFLRLILVVVCVLAFVSPSLAASKAVGYEELSPSTSTAVGLTAATITTLAENYPDLWVIVQCQTYPVAYLWYGTPTSGTYQLLQVGDTVKFEGVYLMRSFKAIGVGGTAHLAVTYFSGR